MVHLGPLVGGGASSIPCELHFSVYFSIVIPLVFIFLFYYPIQKLTVDSILELWDHTLNQDCEVSNIIYSMTELQIFKIRFFLVIATDIE